MKKLPLTSLTVLLLFSLLKSQTATTTVVSDTLHYYYNKFYFKSNIAKISGPVTSTLYPGNTAALVSPAPYYKSPSKKFAGALLLGNKFENNEPLEIKGLEAVIAKGNSTYGIFDIPARIYLFDLDNNGKPKMPPIDSVEIYTNSKQPRVWGANFTNGPHTVTGDFAIMVQNSSTADGDTVIVYHTACTTHTAYSAGPIQNRYSDGYGFIRHLGVFYNATNYSVTPGFGPGTDYEFFVAPRVSYTLNVQQTLPPKVVNSETLCTSTPVTFSNSSSPRLTNRMYNLLEMYKKWSQPYAPMPNSPTNGWPNDSTISWKFDFEDNNNTQAGKINLPYGSVTNAVLFQTDSVLTPICSNQNFFLVSFKKMGLYGNGDVLKYKESIDMCVNYCNGDALALKGVGSLESLGIYPNPSKSGKVTIKGLSDKVSIMVYNLTGQLVFKTQTISENETIDLSSQPKGAYWFKVESKDISKTMIVLKSSE